jgi:hypothetical protein
MYRVSKYKHAESSSIEGIIEVEEVFKIIKDGDSNLSHIKYARGFKKGTKDYDDIKKRLIPTFRFNFHFKEKAVNKNITKPTGLMYIDADNIDKIPESKYVFAKWKSLSQTGFSILVKVENLSQTNFSNSYNFISRLINIKSDEGARKATQQTIQSYDSDIYINYNSTIINCLDIKKVSYPIKQKKKRCLTTNETFFNSERGNKVRYNNIEDYFINNDLLYIVFREKKERLCIPFIPKKVEEGNRNNYLFIYLSQIVALNTQINKAYVKVLSESINLNVMRPKLSNDEQDKVINSIFNLKESGELIMIFNKERRIIFNPNPNHKISFKDKMGIVNKELGKLRKKVTEETIYACIEEWDFNSNEKITQKKVAKSLDKSVSTVKRYWYNFKEYVKELNEEYKSNNNKQDIECCIDYSYFYISKPLLNKSA